MGPDGSANGGYACGRVAAYVDAADAVEVTLRLPPPLERPLAVERDGDAASACSTAMRSSPRRGPARSTSSRRGLVGRGGSEAAERALGAEEHEFPRCFVCGPLREPGDGLRILPGPVRDGVVAAPLDGRATVAPEIVWAAIDCIGAFATGAVGRAAAPCSAG